MDVKLQTASLVKDIFSRYDSTGEGLISREDLVTLLTILGLGDDAELVLREVSEGRNSKLLYRDFVDKVFGVPTSTRQVAIYEAAPGDEVAVPLTSQDGVVTQRTTTDVQMRLQDGNEVWFDIEDVDGGPVIIHEAKSGGKASIDGIGRCEILERTTGELKLRLPDGTEVWRAVEDLEDEAEQSRHAVVAGSNACVVPKALRARVKTRTTTDALVILPNGVEAWCGIEELVSTAVAPSNAAVSRLRLIFNQCDTSKDDYINVREFIKICRKDQSIADFFGLSSTVRQEDGTRDIMERLFQAIDTNSDRQLSWGEFRAFYLDCMSGRGDLIRTQSAPAAIANGAQAALTNA